MQGLGKQRKRITIGHTHRTLKEICSWIGFFPINVLLPRTYWPLFSILSFSEKCQSLQISADCQMPLNTTCFICHFLTVVDFRRKSIFLSFVLINFISMFRTFLSLLIEQNYHDLLNDTHTHTHTHTYTHTDTHTHTHTHTHTQIP